MHRVLAIVGMAGSGKSEIAKVFEQRGYGRIRFGDITDEEVKRRGLELNEENERRVRESLRKEYGMAAYAVLNAARINKVLNTSSVIVDGLYSWEEYVLLSQRYGPNFKVLAVYTSPETRYERLASRKERGLTPEEARQRDYAEIANLNKGGPIAMANFTIVNETTLDELKKETERVIELLK